MTHGRMTHGNRSSAPYLCLSVSQAAALPAPDSPEPQDHTTFTALLEHRARHQSDEIAVGFPQLKTEPPCITYTFKQLHDASEVLAVQLRSRLLDGRTERDGLDGRRQQKQPLLAIYGPSGPRLLLHVLACWKLGAAILPIALGTPATGAASLIVTCKCDAVLFDDQSQAEAIDEVKGVLNGGRFIPWISTEEQESTSLRPDGERVRVEPLRQVKSTDTLVVFHSSGSSGNPKPIAQLHHFWSRSLLSAPGRRSAAFTTTPLYHGGLSDLFRSVQAGAPLYFYPWHEHVAPTVENIVESASAERCGQATVRYFLSVPFILESLIKSDKGSKFLQSMDLVSTGGAPLSESVGDSAVESTTNIKLVSRLGSSECGFLMSSWRDFESDKDWSWLRLEDEVGQSLLRFEREEESGESNNDGKNETSSLYQLIVSPKWPTKQISTRSDGSFATGDLYERHPQYEHRWRYKRRADDNIVMVNGKKVAASLVESLLCHRTKSSSSSLSSSDLIIEEAIVFGANRALLGAIVFPSGGESDDVSVREKLKLLLPVVNRKLPSHARLDLEMIHVGDAALQKMLPRSSKGTLQKGLALDKLTSLIDEIYRRFEEGEAPSTEAKKDLRGRELKSWLKAKIGEICDGNIDEEEDFYRAGIDSIMAARIRAAIHQRLPLGDFRLKQGDVYNHPTIVLLSQFIERRGNESITNGAHDEIKGDAMRVMVTKYSKFGPTAAKDDGHRSSGARTVVLTGATGALGSHILHALIGGARQESKVDKVICIVRASDAISARKRVMASLSERGGLEVPLQKLDFVTNLWELGLKKDITQASSVSVIHCAWIVNFALRLESFEEDCISTLKDLLDFFRSCSTASRFVFCSSLASILGGKGESKDGTYQEKPSSHPSSAGRTGYGQSKWVAEKICEQAGPNVVVTRIGQLCGDTRKGIWNTTEAWPLMIRTAQEVGSLPEAGPPIDWLPVDIAARGIVDLAQATELDQNKRHFHVALPPRMERAAWKDFLSWLREGELRFEEIPKREWIDLVKKNKSQIRGSALIDIWDSIPEDEAEPSLIEVEQAMGHSGALSEAKGVDKALTVKMVGAWRASGFLTG